MLDLSNLRINIIVYVKKKGIVLIDPERHVYEDLKTELLETANHYNFYVEESCMDDTLRIDAPQARMDAYQLASRLTMQFIEKGWTAKLVEDCRD